MNYNTTNITIGIQARSTSTRLPGKVHAFLGGKPILTRVIDTCRGAETYLNQKLGPRGVHVDTAIVVPVGDEIVSRYADMIPIVEGSESDVLSRYVELAKRFKSDYVIRITADCPLIPHNIISGHVYVVVNNSYDYFSNVDEECRTSIDGMDCEIISRRMLTYLDEHATSPADREHVTTLVRREMPKWASIGCSMTHIDHSEMKLSVDTAEDLQRMKDSLAKTQDKHRRALEKYGKKRIHWL